MLCVRWAKTEQLLRVQRCGERGAPSNVIPLAVLASEDPMVSRSWHIKATTRYCAERLVLDWQPFKAPVVKRWTACPLCSATGGQTCSNCLGTGVVVPL